MHRNIEQKINNENVNIEALIEKREPYLSEIDKITEKRIDKRKKLGVWSKNKEKQEILKKLIENEVIETFIDKRFEIPNQQFLRIKTVEELDQAIISQRLNKLGVLWFDVNGLKAVNDFFGHNNGNKYLERIVDTLKQGKAIKSLQEKGFSFSLCSAGGDEFVLTLKSETILLDTLMQEMIQEIQQDIQNIDLSDIIDLKNNVKARNQIQELIQQEIPDNYNSFKASVSGGWSIAQDNMLINDSSYWNNLEQIMGRILDESEQRSKDDKNNYKKKLKEEDSIMFEILKATNR